MKVSFTKMQGLGNDFVVVNATAAPFRPSPELTRHLADRRLGVGCDQILVLEPPSTPDVDFDYRIYNADGSESGQCGNGARCMALFVEQERLSERRALRVRTSTAVLELERRADGAVRVNMGTPRFEPRDIPFDAAARAPRYSVTLDGTGLLELGAVNVGNPHAVLPVPDVDSAAVEAIGPALQRHAAFPQSVNVGFLQVLDRARARLRVYERGAGETPACGSGACAAAAVGQVWGAFGRSVSVQVRGGSLAIDWAGEGHPVFMTGPAHTVYRGELTWPT